MTVWLFYLDSVLISCSLVWSFGLKTSQLWSWKQGSIRRHNLFFRYLLPFLSVVLYLGSSATGLAAGCSYGTKGVFNSINTPGAREGFGMTILNDRIYIFGKTLESSCLFLYGF